MSDFHLAYVQHSQNTINGIMLIRRTSILRKQQTFQYGRRSPTKHSMIRRQEIVGVYIGAIAVSRIHDLRYCPPPVLYGFEQKRAEVNSKPTMADDDIATEKDLLHGPDMAEIRRLEDWSNASSGP